MNFGERLVYWALVIGFAILLSPAIRRICIALLGRGRNVFLYDLVGTPMLVVVYAPPLYFINEVVTQGEQPLTLLSTAAIITGATVVVIILREVFHLHWPAGQPALPAIPVPLAPVLPDAAPPAVDGPPEPREPVEAPAGGVALLNRLPEPLRGEVHVISGANHRVEVRTSQGVATVLMRFSDAVREVEPTPGLQVHRSHWVADGAVVALRRKGSKMLVILRCGNEIPVARSQFQAAQDRWGPLSA